MKFDYHKLLQVIGQAATTSRTATECLSVVISECERQIPHPDWARLREIDFEADAAQVHGWLSRVLAGSSTTQPDALTFWLMTFATEDGETVDLCGTPASTQGADYPDWQFEELRDETFLESKVLQQIYALAYDNVEGLGNEAEYPLTLAYAVMAARLALADAVQRSLLPSLQAAVVGFADGDFLYLGSSVEGEFHLNIRIG